MRDGFPTSALLVLISTAPAACGTSQSGVDAANAVDVADADVANTSDQATVTEGARVGDQIPLATVVIGRVPLTFLESIGPLRRALLRVFWSLDDEGDS
jgi:hypothetical protein